MPADSVSSENPLLGSQQSFFLCPHIAEGAEELSGVSSFFFFFNFMAAPEAYGSSQAGIESKPQL